MAKAEKLHRVGSKEAALELEVYREVHAILNRGQWAGSLHLTGEREAIFSDIHLLTAKPVFYVANVDQEELRGEGSCLKAMMEWTQREGSKVVIICGDLKAELAELKEEERDEFRKELGLGGSS